MTALRVRDLAKRFGAVAALDGVSFEMAEGEFFAILGPTNAGKSTLLKTIAGLHRQDRGSIAVAGRPVDGLLPRERRVSLLFQNIALFPTMTGYQNIAFPLATAGVPAAETRRRVQEVAALLGVEHVLDRFPRTFSGGEQQRVAIGRAIVRRTDLLMLDEPLSNLDARIRIALRLEFKKLHTGLRQSMLYVTHDQVEAMSLSGRIAILDHGRFEQIGTPDEIYHRPRTRFVAAFIGTPPMNLLEAELEGSDAASLVGPGFRVAVPNVERLESRSRLPRALAFGLRPESIRVARAMSEETPFPAEIAWVEHLGPRRVLDLKFGGGIVKAVVSREDRAAAGENAWIGFTPQPHHLLDRASGEFFR